MRRAWLLIGLLLACDARQPSEPVTCPPCECVCDCKGGAAAASAGAPGPGADTGPDSGAESGAHGEEPGLGLGMIAAAGGSDVADLVESASRKMNHGDGQGCLEDLQAIVRIDPKMHRRLAITQGQCEMLVGQCQKGKERISKWYQVETAMTKERADITAEQLGSMRCRGGDSTDRDKLLAALFNLQDGAYMNTRTPEYCRENLDVARRLIPKVKATGPDDTQISGGAQALFHTAAACFGRAKDCVAAFRVYEELFPAKGTIADPATAKKVIRDSFESSITHCKKSP
ncbi:hypothetical protein [Paraliomyxa miuraensis]|uniref:hypothetical protein n=1 Tax=Paraliomyxa miuraensis TaxID=376150 RepID=UPI0022595259|nr:hypothetical protein [Paraliomyxa miuraensis]MCX4247781.1 hypothetical protein [Paraliomyxa miuraensis]